MGDDYDYLGPKFVCNRTACTVRPTLPVGLSAWNGFYPAVGRGAYPVPILDRPVLPGVGCGAGAYEALHAPYVAHDPRVACLPPPYLATQEAGYVEVGYLVPLAHRLPPKPHCDHKHDCDTWHTPFKRGSRFGNKAHDYAGRPHVPCDDHRYDEGCGRRYRLYVRTPGAYGCRAFSSSHQYQYAVREEGVYDAIFITIDQAGRDGCGDHYECGRNGRGRWSELVTGDIVHVPGGCGVPYRVHLYADDYNGRW